MFLSLCRFLDTTFHPGGCQSPGFPGGGGDADSLFWLLDVALGEGLSTAGRGLTDRSVLLVRGLDFFEVPRRPLGEGAGGGEGVFSGVGSLDCFVGVFGSGVCSFPVSLSGVVADSALPSLPRLFFFFFFAFFLGCEGSNSSSKSSSSRTDRTEGRGAEASCSAFKRRSPMRFRRVIALRIAAAMSRLPAVRWSKGVIPSTSRMLGLAPSMSRRPTTARARLSTRFARSHTR